MRYTDEQLTIAVVDSTSYAQVIRKLGLAQAGGTQLHIKNRIRALCLDTSHFVGQAHGKGKRALNRLSTDSVLILGSPLDLKPKRELLKRCMIESGLEYKCSECGQLPIWNDEELVIEIDHVNGNHWDNRPENLRFLCPNCHSQQKTTNRSWRRS